MKIDRSGAAAAAAGAAGAAGAELRAGWRRRVPRFKTSLIALGCWLLAAAVAGGVWWFNRAVEVQSVSVTTAYPSQAVTVLNATGYVVAQRKAAVASKATGRLVWLGVQEGSRVRQGEVVARLEAGDVQAGAEQATANIRQVRANLLQGEAELADAEANLTRTRERVEKKFQSPSVLDQAEAGSKKARAGIASLQAAIAVAQAAARGAQVAVEQTLIRAPFDGVVLTKNANVGDVITPFSNAADSKGAVITMADMRTLEVEADVGEVNLTKIRVGQPCEIVLDAFSGQRYQGTVARIVPTVDRSKASVLVKIRFKQLEERVLPDMSAKVAFLEREMPDHQRAPVLVVHPQAVAERDGKKIVFVIDAGQVRVASA